MVEGKINAGISFFMLTLVYLQQGNVKKSKKLMTIVNIDEENIHILKDESFYESFRKNVPYDD